MGTKKLTTLQHNANKINKKRAQIKEEKLSCKNELKLLQNITKKLPEEIVTYIYSFVNNDVKFNLSHYKSVFTKFIYDFNHINNTKIKLLVFKGYTDYNYCTYEQTAVVLKEILHKIPFEKLEKYIHFGTPSKYFNVAFPDEPEIKEYIGTNYKNKAKKAEDVEFQRKNYIFEILDLISYFSTKANEWHALHCKYNNKYLNQLNLINRVCNDGYLKQTEMYCKQNEMIVKKIILSVIHLSTFSTFRKGGAK
jgi:hypothetical protein